jgi:microcystin-dependent protein
VTTTAQANNAFGGGSCGAHIFSCPTTADVAAIVSQSVVASYPVPVGAISVYTATAIRSGWLACNGQAVNRTTYQDLLTVISYVFGSGDGVTTFNVPDLRGRAPFGNDVMGNTTAARITTAGSSIDGKTTGSAGGTETHTLTTAQIAAHAHPIGSQVVAGGSDSLALCGSYTSTSVGTQNAGSGNAHQNTPPAIILNYMIRALT